MRAFAGVLAPSAGRLEVAGRVALIAEDRTTEGLIPDFTLTENLVLESVGQASASQRVPFRIDWEEQRDRTTGLIAEFDIMAAGPEAPADSLSGGNQQRFVIARALAGNPDLIVAEEPARGLDVRAADEVYARLRAAATAGAGIIVHASDLDELLAIADRVVVIANGVTMEPGAGAGRAEIGRMMLGGQKGEGTGRR
jgi:simple sugar transport system ATP-binding protein